MPTLRATRSHISSIAIAFALSLLLSSCASREERVQRILDEANAAFFENQPAKAIETLSKGIESYSDSNAIRIALANALAEAGETIQAADLITTAIEQEPERVDLWVRVGELRSRAGQSEKAIVAFEAYLESSPKDFLAWKELALENEASGRFTPAIKATLKWNDLAPSAAPALKLGELYYNSDNLPQARSWFGQAAAYNRGADSEEALARLIELETNLKQFQQAETWLKSYTERYGAGSNDPRIIESKRILDSWTRAKVEMAQAAQEIERQRRALEKKAADQAARNTMPALEADDDEVVAQADDAKKTVIPQVTSVTRPPEALFGEDEAPASATSPAETPIENESGPSAETAMQAAKAGNYKKAIDLYWSLLGKNDQDPQLWYEIAKAYYATEGWFDAEACILEARRRAPSSENIATLYGLIVLKTQSPFRALDEIKDLRRLFPRSSGVTLALARALRTSGANRESTTRAYREFLQLSDSSHPGYEEANRFVQRGN